MDKLSRDQERQITQALQETVGLINNGTTPTDALHKVAQAQGFGPQMVQRMAEAINTARMLSHLQKTSGAVRANSFPLADPSNVLERMYPEHVQPEIKQASLTELAQPAAERTNYMRKAAAVKVELPRLKYASYAADPEARAKRTLDQRHNLKQASARAASDYRIEFNRLLHLVEKAASYFKQLEHEPFELVEKKACATYGTLGRRCMDIVFSVANLSREKRASEIPARVIFDAKREPYATIDLLIKQAQTVSSSAEHAVEAEHNLHHFELKSGLRKQAEPALLDEVFSKKAMDPSELLLTHGSTLLGLKDPSSAGPKREAEADVMDPQHEAELNSIGVQAMLNDFLSNDPIIGSYDSGKVIAAYNELSQLAPAMAQQPAVMRGMLRKTLQQEGVVEPFEAQQMADLERKSKSPKDEMDISLSREKQ